jgi:putative spermidine/putrescine transport system substrate-binding protein
MRSLRPRRAMLAAGAAGVALLAAPPRVGAQTRTIVTTLFGGVYEQNYRRFVMEPFTQKTGARFQVRYGSPTEWLTSALINKDDPEIDLPFLSLPVAMKAIGTPGVFLDITPEMVPNLRDVDPLFYDGFDRKAVGFNYVENGIAYRSDRVVPPPLAWADLWDPRFRGQLLLPDIAGGYFYELVVIAARLNGGTETNLEPGYQALRRLRPNIFRWYRSPNELPALLQRGEATVASMGGARAWAVRDGGVPVDFAIPREGAPVGILSFHVPARARNRDLLLAFIDHAMSVEVQTAFGNGMQSGMANRRVQLAADVAPRVAPLDRLLRLDWKQIEPRMGEMAERMQREVISGR